MRKGLLLCLISFSCFTVAHADTIDDFVLTGGGNVITYSLPATSSYPDFDLFNFFAEAAPGTINGVSGYTIAGDYYDPAFYHSVSIVYYLPAAPGMLELLGPNFINFAFVPANNAYPYLPYDVVPTFIPGTYTFDNLPNSVSYTLQITPEAAAPAPEPPTVTLLATGVLGLLGVARSRRSRIRKSEPAICQSC